MALANYSVLERRRRRGKEKKMRKKLKEYSRDFGRFRAIPGDTVAILSGFITVWIRMFRMLRVTFLSETDENCPWKMLYHTRDFVQIADPYFCN